MIHDTPDDATLTRHAASQPDRMHLSSPAFLGLRQSRDLPRALFETEAGGGQCSTVIMVPSQKTLPSWQLGGFTAVEMQLSSVVAFYM